ncbi:bifunctional phosphoribosyl-AMP cyclohydrolase/phosphoribosyl-ATP diphosphatase HisIE [Sphingomicrobium marinum]|nr:bifunctional phosphoribosyl-AMP cyclohydrolase/phosphoribosyl-ATP diphosphatase HisIE [Sphingomicrobium marinum]
MIPAIVQQADTGEVRMLGYMNREALDATQASGKVTFWSRSRGELWEKGAISGDTLDLVDMRTDCDGDALLVLARPAGPTCHLGTTSCFGDEGAPGVGFLGELATVISARAAGADAQASYTARLLAKGVKRCAQKVGEEGVETALAATAGDKRETASEAADLLYHLLVLLEATDVPLDDVLAVLKDRHKA